MSVLDMRRLTIETVSVLAGLRMHDDWGRCPTCGCSQEDASPRGEVYACPECGDRYSDDEARS